MTGVFSRFIRPFLRTWSAVFLGQAIAFLLTAWFYETVSAWWLVGIGVGAMVLSFGLDGWDRMITSRMYRGLEEQYQRATGYWQAVDPTQKPGRHRPKGHSAITVSDTPLSSAPSSDTLDRHTEPPGAS